MLGEEEVESERGGRIREGARVMRDHCSFRSGVLTRRTSDKGVSFQPIGEPNGAEQTCVDSRRLSRW